jgi:YNFM family putative membrane transporter
VNDKAEPLHSPDSGPSSVSQAAHAGWIDVGTSAFSRVRWSLFAAGFSTFAQLYFVQPLLPVFSHDFGISPAASSLALSLATGVLAIATLAGGAISDGIGRKQVMGASLFASAFLTLCLAAAPSWGTLLILRFLAGISLSGVQAVGIAYLAEEMKPEAFGRALGLFIAGGVIGGMAGRLMMSFIVDVASWRTASFLLGAVALCAAIAFWRYLPASRNFGGRQAALDFRGALRTHLTHRTLILLFIEAFLLMGGFVTLFNYLTFRLVGPPFGLTQTFAGAVFAVYIAGIFSSIWAGGLAARVGRPMVFRGGLAIIAIGLLLTLSNNLAVIVLGAAVFTFGFFASHSVANGWVSQAARSNKALAASLYLFFYYQGSSLVGSFGGLFWARFGWIGIVALIGGLLAVAILIAMMLKADTASNAD